MITIPDIVKQGTMPDLVRDAAFPEADVSQNNLIVLDAIPYCLESLKLIAPSTSEPPHRKARDGGGHIHSMPTSHGPETPSPVEHMLKGFTVSVTPLDADGIPEHSARISPKRHEAQTEESVDDSSHVRKAGEPTLYIGSFGRIAKEVLSKIDRHHKGALTREEITIALQDRSFKGRSAQALVALYENFARIQQITNCHDSHGAGVITCADLDILQKKIDFKLKLVEDATSTSAWAGKNLMRFTQCGSDHLSERDLNLALTDHHLSKDDRFALEYMQKNFSRMTDGVRGISAGFAAKWQDTASDDFDQDGRMITLIYGTCEEVAAEAQSKGLCTDLYSTADPLKSIVPEAVRQGRLGDCFFESAVAAVAKSHPEEIAHAIKQNSNGTYTVTFPGASSEPVTVTAPTESELGAFGHGSKYGVWAAVLEKAFATYTEKTNRHNCTAPQEAIDDGGTVQSAIEILTGHDSKRIDLSTAAKSTVFNELLQACWHNPNPAMVTSTAKIDGKNRTTDNFPTNHSFTVVDFIPKAQGNGIVIIRNPYGGKDGTVDGTIEISIDEYMKNFKVLVLEK
jgi:Calpain family cysteine protease